MNTLVAFSSQSGNTEKVAGAIFEVLPEPKELKRLEEVESLEGYDVVFVGFPVHAGGPAVVGKEFLEKNASGASIAMFVTHAAPEDEAESEGWLENCQAAAADADLLGFFHCQGAPSQMVVDFLLKADDPKLRAFGERGASGAGAGQPDEERLEKARAFARGITHGE